MILYDYNSNAILADPMKIWNNRETICAFQTLHAHLIYRGLKPRFQNLDNKYSASPKTLLQKEEINFQLTPPHMHCHNAAERSIQTLKHNFISGLFSINNNSSLQLWCWIIPQSVTKINLLQLYCLNPQMSAKAQLNGTLNYNQTPLAPTGIKLVIHDNYN